MQATILAFRALSFTAQKKKRMEHIDLGFIGFVGFPR